MGFDSLVGNGALVARLKSMAATGRVPPSLLFSGPAGVGKHEAAKALAKALMCPLGEGDACDACPACARIEREEHPDVRVVRPEGAGRQIRADSIRQIISEAPFRPFEGGRRVYLLLDAERLNPASGNTLLKTLEEPPPWVVFVLVTSNEAAVLPTILSRCQVFRFAPIAVDELAALLVERHGVAEERARLLASLSGGRRERALQLLEEPLSELRDQALRLAGVVAEQTPARELVPWADALAKESRLLLVLQLALGLARDTAAALAGGVLVHQDLRPELTRLASKAPLRVWLRAQELTEEALLDLRDRYLNKRITMTRLLSDLSALGEP